MTPIHRHEGKPVVRSGNLVPSPYLRSIRPFLEKVASSCMSQNMMPRAVDVGCGNGRNSKFMAGLGFEVISFDRKPDYGHQIELGERELPVFPGTANVVLLQYVLMFLEHGSGMTPRYKVIMQSLGMCGFPGAIVVELAAVKSSLCKTTGDCLTIKDGLVRMAKSARWEVRDDRGLHFTLTNLHDFA